MQLERIDKFETYTSSVQWTTVRLMLIVKVLLQLKSNQGDIAAAFLHSKLEENEKLFVDMPKLFEQYNKRGNWRVLRLK